MNPLFLSLSAGILIGLFYGLLRVRSPAPPAIALVGLAGMLLGGALVHAGWPAEKTATATQSLMATPVSHVKRMS